MNRCRRALLPLLAGTSAAALYAMPLTAQAAELPSIDSLWLQRDGIAIDSPLYPLQAWWDGFNQQVSNDPTQRGLGELNQANADLLNAYTLLQEEHSTAGPDPVPVIDPFLSTVYDAVTGSDVHAPLGSLGSWFGQSLRAIEGRGSTPEQVQALLQDYRAKQAVAVRDLHRQPSIALQTLLQQNGQRQADFLSRVTAASAPGDGVGALLADADAQTAAVAASGDFSALQHRPVPGSQGKGNGNAGNGKSHAGGNGSRQGHGSPKGKQPDRRQQPSNPD